MNPTPVAGHNQAKKRYEREQAFHDERFGSGEARAASRFYVLNRPAEMQYRAAVAAAEPGTRIVEYGCGTGGEAFTLGERGIGVTGIDISRVAVAVAATEAARRRLPAVSFAVMNAEQLALPDRCVDLVFGSGILHHLDLDRSAAEVARVLRDGGRAVFLEPLGHNPLINLYRQLTPAQRTADEHPLRRSDIDALGSRFTRLTCRSYTFLTLAALPLLGSHHLPAVVDRLSALDNRLFRRFPPLADLAWTVVLELEGPRQ